MINIFCEGIGDQIFIADFIEFHFKITFVRKNTKRDKIDISNDIISILSLDGCDKIHSQINKDRFIENTERGGNNFVVFDADYVNRNGNNGFSNCCKMLDNLKKEISFEYFLWPDHNNDGYLEDVQRNMIPNDKLPILSCMDNHFLCLDALRKEHSIKAFDDKSKISIYLYYCEKDNTASTIRYNDERYWSLNIEKNVGLSRFYEFLLNHLIAEKKDVQDENVTQIS